MANGHQVLDACGGAAVSCLGYSPAYKAEVAAAVADQIQNIPYVHTLIYTTSASELAAQELLDGNPHGFEKVYFVGSGSEAVESALRFARQYFFETGQHERVHYIARRQSFHGNTIGAMSIGNHLRRKEAYQGVFQLPYTSWVTPAYAYQYSDWRNGETEEQFANRLVRELEDEIVQVGEKRVIAFIAETASGATLGCVRAPRGYWSGVRRVCDKYGVLLILDEVMCGVGRTGSFYAFEREGEEEGLTIRPDILTLAKGLGGGMGTVAAVILGNKVVAGLRDGSGKGELRNGHTYQAHPVSCRIALTVQRILKREKLVERCRAMGLVLEKLLKEALAEKKYVGDIRGNGLFWGVEFVRNRETREPFDSEVQWTARLQQRVFDKGVAIFPGTGSVDGWKGDHIILAPAYTITEDELKTVVRAVEEAYNEIEAEVDA
ncbi:hypothetical protein DV735_g4754, partial [Chaetothyriales sp. CBS 134920]